MRVGVLSSGGKDSLFACWRAMQQEEVVCLITLLSANEESWMFHTPNISLSALQAEAAGLPLVSEKTAGEKETELVNLKSALRRAVTDHGIEGVVTGAILSVYQASRIQRICHSLGLWCFNPLWHVDQEAYMRELISSGFEVIIAGVFSAPFDESWLGRRVDAAALSDLKKARELYHISLTGEGGEIETSVLDAPFFKKRIRVVAASQRYANHNGRYIIEEAELVSK